MKTAEGNVTPDYIADFMYDGFRSEEGTDLSFDLKKWDETYVDKLDGRKGCYVISSTRKKFTYPNGEQSRVLYIGLSNNLYKRLGTHFRNLKKLMDNPDYGVEGNNITMLANRYQYMYYHGARVDVFFCKGKQSEKEFESMLMTYFYCKYRSVPVGNGARSFSQR